MATSRSRVSMPVRHPWLLGFLGLSFEVEYYEGRKGMRGKRDKRVSDEKNDERIRKSTA